MWTTTNEINLGKTEGYKFTAIDFIAAVGSKRDFRIGWQDNRSVNFCYDAHLCAIHENEN